MKMHKTIFYLFLTLLLFVNVAFSQEFYNINTNRSDFIFKINPSIPEFTFSIFFRFDTLKRPVGILRIEIRRSDKSRILQTIRTKQSGGSYEFDNRYRFFSRDMNFDGYLDLLLSLGQPGSGGDYYEIFIYDPKSGTFKRDPQFDEILTPVVDTVAKTITSNFAGGVHSFNRDTYHYENGKLVCIRREDEEYNENVRCFIRKTTLYKHKKVISVQIDTLRER
jgi:hypothetical protein